MLFWVISMILIVSAIQASMEDKIAGLVFIFPIVLHEIVGPYMTAWGYYVSDGLVGFIVAGMLLNCFKSRLSEMLGWAAVISIGLNFFGWALWESGANHAPYNAVFLEFYGLVLFLLAKYGSVECGRVGENSQRPSRLWL